MRENCECKTVNTVHWFDASCSVIPYYQYSPNSCAIFFAADSICVALQISEQFSPKARTPAHWMPSSDQILTQSHHSRSFKVIRFGVSEEPLRGYIAQHNNCGLECECSEDIASERSENRHLRPPHSHLMALI